VWALLLTVTLVVVCLSPCAQTIGAKIDVSGPSFETPFVDLSAPQWGGSGGGALLQCPMEQTGVRPSSKPVRSLSQDGVMPCKATLGESGFALRGGGRAPSPLRHLLVPVSAHAPPASE